MAKNHYVNHISRLRFLTWRDVDNRKAHANIQTRENAENSNNFMDRS